MGANGEPHQRLTLALALTLAPTLALTLTPTLTLTQASIISDKTFRVWNALEKALQKYNALVSARSSTIDEVAELQQQNGELKALLNQYLSSKINEDLHVPPTQVIQLDKLRELPVAQGLQRLYSDV